MRLCDNNSSGQCAVPTAGVTKGNTLQQFKVQHKTMKQTTTPSSPSLGNLNVKILTFIFNLLSTNRLTINEDLPHYIFSIYREINTTRSWCSTTTTLDESYPEDLRSGQRSYPGTYSPWCGLDSRTTDKQITYYQRPIFTLEKELQNTCETTLCEID